MERIPESFKLTEEDIKEAITYWLNQEHGDGNYDYEYDIEFDVQVKREVHKGGPWVPGSSFGDGPSDTLEVKIVSAKASKSE